MITGSLDATPESTHEAVLMHLKKNAEMTVAQLCQALGITAMAVRRHLSGLNKQGLVKSRIVRQGRGRPTYRYSLTERANTRLFPSGAENLAADILDAVYEQSGHKGVMDMLALRQNHLANTLKARLDGKNLRQRVEEVAKIFSESGFMTESQALSDGNFVIFQRHCALHSMASRYRQLCILEPRLIETLLGVKVTRQQYILKNDPVCAYMVHAGQTAIA